MERDTPLRGARTPSARANTKFFTRLRFLAASGEAETLAKLVERWFRVHRDMNALPDEPETLAVAALMRLVASLLFPVWPFAGREGYNSLIIVDVAQNCSWPVCQ